MTQLGKVVSTTFRAMASDINVTLVSPNVDAPETVLEECSQLFSQYEQALSRFRSDSDLTLANNSLGQEVSVSPILAEAVKAAHDAYVATRGLFDPRVLDTLENLGYNTNFKDMKRSAPGPASLPLHIFRTPSTVWEPKVTKTTVNLGNSRVDLGGIGKGFTVDHAADIARRASEGGLVEAGGDLVVFGPSPDGTTWKIGVENPNDRDGEPLAVLAVTDTAVATSSLSVRHWAHNGINVHHLIDPRTGQPSTSTLLAVTVLAATATDAEVLSKALFVAGEQRLVDYTREHNVAALWVASDGRLEHSDAMTSHIIWSSAA